MGRSPEMPCGHKRGRPQLILLENVARRAQRAHRSTARDWRCAETAAPPRSRCRGSAAAPAPESTPASWPARRPPCRDACRPARAPAARLALTPVQKCNARGFSGRDAHPAPQRQHRVEHRADGVDSGRASRIETRIAQVASAAEEARAVGFELQAADGLALQRADVDHPQLRLRGLPGAARGEQARRCRRRIRSARTSWRRPDARQSASGGRQHHFRIGGQFDFADARCLRLVTDTRRTSASSSGDTRISVEVRMGPSRRVISRTILEEGDLVAVGLAADRLIAGRPHLAVRPRRAGKCSSPRDRRSDPRASASRQCRASGCTRSRPR